MKYYVGMKHDAWCELNDEEEGEFLDGQLVEIKDIGKLSATFLVRSAITGSLWELCGQMEDGNFDCLDAENLGLQKK